MAKKIKRSAGNGNGSGAISIETPVAAPGKVSGFNPDYSYVMKDLRRIGMLAGLFIVILVALSFVIR